MPPSSPWTRGRIILAGATLVAVLAGGMFFGRMGFGLGEKPGTGIGEGVSVGKLAPDFTLPTLDGGRVSLADYRGRTVFLNFWATWCPPCKEEMPFIEAIHREKDRDVVVLGVDLGESRETVRAFARKNGITFPILLDGSTRVMEQYNVRYIPTSLFINPQGIICVRQETAMTREMMLEAIGKARGSCEGS